MCQHKKWFLIVIAATQIILRGWETEVAGIFITYNILLIFVLYDKNTSEKFLDVP